MFSAGKKNIITQRYLSTSTSHCLPPSVMFLPILANRTGPPFCLGCTVTDKIPFSILQFIFLSLISNRAYSTFLLYFFPSFYSSNSNLLSITAILILHSLCSFVLFSPYFYLNLSPFLFIQVPLLLGLLCSNVLCIPLYSFSSCCCCCAVPPLLFLLLVLPQVVIVKLSLLVVVYCCCC